MTGQIIRGFSCPECGDESLTYNGNYYCLNGDCWAMSPDVPIRRQPTWELELMVAYMTIENAEQFAIYIDPLVDELKRREAEQIDVVPIRVVDEDGSVSWEGVTEISTPEGDE